MPNIHSGELSGFIDQANHYLQYFDKGVILAPEQEGEFPVWWQETLQCDSVTIALSGGRNNKQLKRE